MIDLSGLTLEDLLSPEPVPAAAGRTYTPQQQAIFASAKSGASKFIKAYAGTGKTTTLVEFVNQLDPGRTILALAFNKRNKEDLEKRLPPYCVVKTMNGLGASAVGKALGRKLILNDNKLGDIIREVGQDAGYDRIDTETWTNVRTLVNLARNAGLVPTNIPFSATRLVEDSPEVWEALADTQLIEFTPELMSLARETLRRSISMAMAGTVDFNDQIYISALISGSFTKYGRVIVDEAQDLSPLNHIQVRKSLLPDADLTIVGDPKQAIYAFRGADASSMEKLRALRSSWIDLPLAVTFRCPKVVVARQQEHAAGYEAHESNAVGEFHQLGEKWTWNQVQDLAGAGSVACLCRNNAPTISMAFKLLRNLVPVTVLGRDIGKSLVALASKICGKDLSLSADKCLEAIERWKDREVINAKARKKEEKLDLIYDRAESLSAVIEAGGAETLKDILALLHSIFDEGTNKIILSTGHKAKGMEWDTVLHLDPWRIPSKWARRSAEEGNPVPLEQDLNLRYVIETRAQRVLIQANLEDFGGIK